MITVLSTAAAGWRAAGLSVLAANAPRQACRRPEATAPRCVHADARDNAATAGEDEPVYPASVSPPPRGLRAQWSRLSSRRRVALIGALAVLLVVVGTASWWGAVTVRNTIRPSGQPKLELLRRVPHPAGAVAVRHLTRPGTIDSQATAWLTYQLPAGDPDACRALLATFSATGVDEEFQKAADPIATYCKPQGRGFASYCVPRVVCFLADFGDATRPGQYTLSTGSQSGG
jgi:hypothetical protein